MTDTAPRADCAAAGTDDAIVCERCGLEWAAGETRPPCEPITFEILRRAVDSDAFKAEVALDDARVGRAAGQPISVSAARRRYAIAEKIRHIVDVATRDKDIIAKLTPAAPARARSEKKS